MQRDYELILIVSPETSEENLKTILDGVSRSITDGGGTINTIDQWGKRKLAYPIKQFSEGLYVLTKFKTETKRTAEIEANLHLSEAVLRHLLIKVE